MPFILKWVWIKLMSFGQFLCEQFLCSFNDKLENMKFIAKINGMPIAYAQGYRYDRASTFV